MNLWCKKQLPKQNTIYEARGPNKIQKENRGGDRVSTNLNNVVWSFRLLVEVLCFESLAARCYLGIFKE